MAIIAIPRPLREKLGEDGADALVELLNQVSQNSRADTLTFVEEKFERRLSEEIAKVNQRITEEISRLDQKISANQANLIKWMFIFWVGQIAVMSGIFFAMLRLAVT